MQGPEGHRPGRRRDLRPPRPGPRHPGTDPPVQQPRQVQRRDQPDRVAAGPQPRRRHDHHQGRQGGQDPPHQPGRQREVRRTKTSVDSWESGEQQLAAAGTAATTSTRARSSSGDLEKLQQLLPRPRLRRLQRGLHPGRDQPRQAATCSSPPASPRASSTRSPASRSPATPCCRRSRSRSWCWSSRSQIFSRAPARVHLRRDHRHAGQHRLRLRAGESDPGRRPREPARSASTCRSCPARASTCAASCSRATPAPPTR